MFLDGSGTHPKFVKIISADEFTENDRWDVQRFWTDEELISLGIREPSIDREEFVDEISERLIKASEELARAKKDIVRAQPSDKHSETVLLSDEKLFEVRSGERVTTEQIRSNAGSLPVYSCFRTADIVKGLVSDEWLTGGNFSVEEKPFVSINANGASVGRVFVRRDRCFITDDVILVRPLRKDIDLDFLAYQLRSAISAGGFIYEAKLFKGRVQNLIVTLPTTASGKRFDLGKQKEIAAAFKRFDAVRATLHELGRWSLEANVK